VSATLADQVMRRWGQLDAEYQRHVGVWRRCYELTYPERADGMQGDEVDAEKAQRDKAEILDATGTDAVRLMTSSVVSGTTPGNMVWFGLDVGEENDEETRWLDEAAHVMWEAIHGSNFESTRFEQVLDSIICGWAVTFIDEDADGQLRFTPWPLSECRIACSQPSGRADIVYRRFSLTAEQAINAYGNAVSEKIRANAQDKPDTKHEFIVAVYPRPATEGRMARRLPVASVHIECSEKRVLRESGYHESPVVVPRWMQLPRSAYALGPVSNALPTIRELNELLRLEKAALSRAVAGVYVGVDDGIFNPRNVKVRGGMVIVANSVDSIRELPSGADFNVSFSKAEDLRREIRRLLLADQLQPQDGPAMTATEVHVRMAIVRQLLGPMFGRLQTEDLQPTIERVFGIMFRRGRPELGGRPGPVAIEDPPETLAGESFRVRYQSPLARAQRMQDVTATQQLVGIGAQLAQAGMPQALDLLDAEQIMRDAQKGLGAPSKSLKDDKTVAAERQARQELEQQQAQQAQAQQMQTMAADAALKRAPMAA